LPEFLPTLAVGTPAIRIFFDIFVGEHRLECPTSMRLVEDILDQEPIGVKGGHEQFRDLLTHTLAHSYGLVCGRSAMSGHDHSSLRQALLQFQPASIKEIDDRIGLHARHPRCRRMIQRTLDLGMLQEVRASSPRHEGHTCENDLSDHSRVAILSVETYQSHLCWES
jgi:hypothetical protein